MNATSLNSKKRKELEIVGSNSDIIFVTETWFNEKSVTNIRDYVFHHRNRRGKKGGGVCIYVKD